MGFLDAPMNRVEKLWRWCLGIASSVVIAGCMSLPPASEPIPVREMKAGPRPSERLVVVLPGRGDDLDNLQRSEIASHIQRAVPGTDVLLVEATFGYYMEGRLVPRLHEEVIAPARQRGYREIWLAGASMGGLGALMYEHEHPNEVAGLVLMAPYMGPGSLQKEIRAAGGLAQWAPGERPATLDRDNVFREEWRVVQSWLTDPARAQSVWLICGDEDRLLRAAEVVATALPPEHVLRRPGGHRWTVWSPAAAEALASAIAKQHVQGAAPRAIEPIEEERLLLAF